MWCCPVEIGTYAGKTCTLKKIAGINSSFVELPKVI
jgi:hypothetical protein